MSPSGSRPRPSLAWLLPALLVLVPAIVQDARAGDSALVEAGIPPILAHLAHNPQATSLPDNLRHRDPWWRDRPLRQEREISQHLLAVGVPVTGKAKKVLVPLSKHVGQARIIHLNGPDQDALYVFITSESKYFGDLRFSLPAQMETMNGVPCALLGPNQEASLEFPRDAVVTMTIRAKDVKFRGEEVKELQSEIEIRFTRADGTEVFQKLKIIPERLVELEGCKRKDVRLEFEWKTRTSEGRKSKDKAEFALSELRSEDFEGRSGGPPEFKRDR